MASSNVSYYEKQKDLQETITNCEQQRLELEKQFRLALQADQTSSKMKATRLNAYWKKICEDERRAKQRNEMLMREFERIDAHMAEMNARTQRLALVKKQYEDYISRTYPQWDELMHGSPGKQQQEQQQQHQQQQQEQQQQQQEPDRQREPQQQPPAQTLYQPTIQPQQEEDQKRKQQLQQQHQQQQQQIKNQEQLKREQQQQQKQEQQQLSHSLQNGSEHRSPQRDTYSPYQNVVANQAPISNPESVIETVSSEYANLPGPASQQDSQAFASASKLSSQPQQQQQQQQWQQQQQSQQLHAVEVHHHISNNGTSPEDNEEGEEEETSEFGSDTDIPMGQSLGNTQVRVDPQPAPQEAKVKSKLTGSIKAELTADGLFLLLRQVEADVREAFSLEGYYRSSWPDSATKTNIIRAANDGTDLSRVDANLVSMVVLEQITLIVRNLAEKTLLPQGLLEGNLAALTADKLRQHLSPEAQVIWDALFSHFVALVTAGVMEPHELSAIFTPCMVADGDAQEKAHAFIVHLLESVGGPGEESPAHQQRGAHWNKGVSPKSTLEGSGSFAEDGRVPPLKFGSLLDKPMSDDESSYINSSLPRDAVPLNETAAYKNMISGTVNQAPTRQQSSGPEDTDDDVEKQVASAIATKPVAAVTPRSSRGVEERSETSSQTATVHTPSHVYVPTALEASKSRQPSNILQSSQNKFQGVKISSDLDTDTEVDAGIFGSSRKPSDNFDFDFYD